MALELINVTGTGDDRKVVLWEKHEEHPDGGEAFLSNDGITRQVAKTTAVATLIGQGKLKEGGSTTPKPTTSRNASVPPLRPATEQEEDAARLETPVEKATAVTPVTPKKG